MIQANLNKISPATLERLAVLAQEDGLNLDEYFGKMAEYWVSHPIKFQQIYPTHSPNKLTARQAKLPDIEEPASHNQAFIEHLLSMPTLEGYDDVELFPRDTSSANVPDFSE